MHDFWPFSVEMSETWDPTCQFYVLKSPSHLYTLFDHDPWEKKIHLPKSIFLQIFISEKCVPLSICFEDSVGGQLGLKLFWTIFFDEENTLESNTFSPLLDGIFHQHFSTDWKILVLELTTLFFLDKNHVFSSTHSTHFVFIFGMLQRIIHPVSPSIR